MCYFRKRNHTTNNVNATNQDIVQETRATQTCTCNGDLNGPAQIPNTGITRQHDLYIILSLESFCETVADYAIGVKITGVI